MYKVLKGYDGFRATIVEEIDRKPISFGPRSDWRKRDKISYKGEYYTVFLLPAAYGELAGRCISI
jgi:hypothetical protein